MTSETGSPAPQAAHHEHIRSDTEVTLASDRTFGLVFCVFWALVGLLPLVRARPVRWWALAASGVCLLAAWWMPRILLPLNYFWARLAMLLQRIVSPVVLALVFFAAFMPTGILLRLFGKDLLRLRPDLDGETYWIPRDPPGPQPETMTHQF